MPFSIIGSIARSLAKAVSQAKKSSGSSSSSTKSSGSSSGSKSTTSGGSVWSSGGLSSHTYTVDTKGNIYKNGRYVFQVLIGRLKTSTVPVDVNWNGFVSSPYR